MVTGSTLTSTLQDAFLQLSSRTDTRSLTEQAQAAFVAGWASATRTAPVTDRTRAAAATAVAVAVEHADTPGVVEATLTLGSLEGMWAEIYARRETLYTRHIAAVTKAWRALLDDGFDAAGLVGEIQRQLGVREADQPLTDQQRREREAAAIALALAALQRLFTATRDTTYRALITSVEQGLRDGVAEGTAGAIAIAAQQLGHTTIAFDRAFTDARNALTDVEQYTDLAGQWTQRTAGAAARDLGRCIVDQIDHGASNQQTTAVTEPKAGWWKRSVGAITDWAMGHTFTLGALAVYAALRIASVEWITVGDSRVCARCQALEAGSPYMIFGAPSPPTHPRCRCVTVPAGALASLGKFATYLTGG